jgi:hypothetical protein
MKGDMHMTEPTETPLDPAAALLSTIRGRIETAERDGQASASVPLDDLRRLLALVAEKQAGIDSLSDAYVAAVTERTDALKARDEAKDLAGRWKASADAARKLLEVADARIGLLRDHLARKSETIRLLTEGWDGVYMAHPVVTTRVLSRIAATGRQIVSFGYDRNGQLRTVVSVGPARRTADTPTDDAAPAAVTLVVDPDWSTAARPDEGDRDAQRPAAGTPDPRVLAALRPRASASPTTRRGGAARTASGTRRTCRATCRRKAPGSTGRGTSMLSRQSGRNRRWRGSVHFPASSGSKRVTSARCAISRQCCSANTARHCRGSCAVSAASNTRTRWSYSCRAHGATPARIRG